MSQNEKEASQEPVSDGTIKARTKSTAERRAARAQAQAALVAKQQEALRLKLAGATLDDIARQLGYSHPSAARKAYLAALHSPSRESVAQAREIERLRLERLHLLWWLRATANPTAPDPEATDRVLKISAARVALLGLARPFRKRVEHSGPGGGPIEHKDSQAPDWSQLTVEELRLLKDLHERARQTPEAGGAPASEPCGPPAGLPAEPAGSADDAATFGGEVAL